MDNWVVLSLVASALWAGVSVVDKIIIQKYIPDPIIYSFFLGTYGLLSALVVGSTGQVHDASLGAILPAFLSGVLYLIYIILYFAALSHNDTTAVVALGQITPIFAAAWGYFILGEIFEITSYIGVVIVVLGVVLISLERRREATRPRFRFNRALQLMVIACCMRSLSDLMLKYPLEEMSAWGAFFWPRLGIFIGTLVLLAFSSMRQQLWAALKRVGWRVNLVIMGSEITALAGVLAITLAYKRGPLTLIAASVSTQPLFILLFVWFVNSIRQGMVPDRTYSNLLTSRLLPLFMIIVGAYLLIGG